MTHLNDALRRFDGQRRVWTAGLERTLLGWLASRSALPPSSQAPRRILVIRGTNRIGNNLFLLPFLHQLHRAHPTPSWSWCAATTLLPFLADLPCGTFIRSGCRADTCRAPSRHSRVCAASTTTGSTSLRLQYGSLHRRLGTGP